MERSSLDQARERLRVPAGQTPDEFLTQALGPASESAERLLSFMVHEIRNPLASALWSAEMLARHPTGDQRRDRLAVLAVRSVRRLRVLLEDLFALERLPAQVVPGEVSLLRAVERATSPHDLEPDGIELLRPPIPETLVVALEPLILDRLLHACLRRAMHVEGLGPLRMELDIRDQSVELRIVRPGVLPEVMDPPLLSSLGSEGEGTAFTMMLARALAIRIQIPFHVAPSGEGAAIVLELPRAT